MYHSLERQREILLPSPVQVYCFDFKEASIVRLTSFCPDKCFSINSVNYHQVSILP